MNNQPTITIGSLVRNRAWILPDFLKHIEDIDYPKNLIEVIFIINDSTDDSLQILNNFKKEYNHHYKKITIEQYNRNAPEDERTVNTRKNYIYDHLAILRNYLMSKVKTDYFLNIDSDILVPSNILINLLSHKKEAISSIIFNGYELHPNEPWKYPNIMKVATHMKIADKWVNVYSHIQNYYVKNANNLKEDKVIEVDLTGAVFLVSKKIYEKAKYGYHTCGEDAIFCEEIKKLGFKIYCNLGLFSKHVMNKNNKN